MKLLILTQKIDEKDPILGFFHGSVKSFSEVFEDITVICLEKGKCDLPENVKVLSLGKEIKRSRVKYLWRFYKYIWLCRRDYDVVFVHMNQEYILLGSLVWKLLGKKIFLWRNHRVGNFLTDLAVLLSNKVFCTSKFSYTFKYKKTILMPVGIDTNLFKIVGDRKREPNSILFLGRIAPIKKPDILIDALRILDRNGVKFKAVICGNTESNNIGYYKKLEKMTKGLNIVFLNGLSNVETVDLYNDFEFFVNLTGFGSMDKTVFESILCGCIPIVSNPAFEEFLSKECIFSQDNAEDLALKLSKMFIVNQDIKSATIGRNMEYVRREHSLLKLRENLINSLK